MEHYLFNDLMNWTISDVLLLSKYNGIDTDSVLEVLRQNSAKNIMIAGKLVQSNMASGCGWSNCKCPCDKGFYCNKDTKRCRRRRSLVARPKTFVSRNDKYLAEAKKEEIQSIAQHIALLTRTKTPTREMQIAAANVVNDNDNDNDDDKFYSPDNDIFYSPHHDDDGNNNNISCNSILGAVIPVNIDLLSPNARHDALMVFLKNTLSLHNLQKCFGAERDLECSGIRDLYNTQIESLVKQWEIICREHNAPARTLCVGKSLIRYRMRVYSRTRLNPTNERWCGAEELVKRDYDKYGCKSDDFETQCPSEDYLAKKLGLQHIADDDQKWNDLCKSAEHTNLFYNIGSKLLGIFGY